MNTLPEEIKKRYELEAEQVYPGVNATDRKLHITQIEYVKDLRGTYLAARLKGFEEMMEFAEWIANDYEELSGTWVHYLEDKTKASNRKSTHDLYTIFLNSKTK